MTDSLAEKHCKPCEGGVPALTNEQASNLMEALHPDWTLRDDGKEISRTFAFKAYSRTMAFTIAVAWIATNEGHHPDLVVSYGKCIVNYSTHAVGGLTDNDFICAAKIDRCANTVLSD